MFIYNKIKRFRIRKKIKNINLNRMIVYKTSRHIYVNILSKNGKFTEVHVSTLEKSINKYLKKNNIYTGNIKSSIIIGKILAIRSINKGINKVYLDRSGFKFHGRIKYLVNSSISNGLII